MWRINILMFRSSIFCGCTLTGMKHTDLVYFSLCHLHPPSFTRLSCDIKTHDPKCLIPLSHHPPSNPELFLIIIFSSSKAPSVTSSNTSQDKSAVLLPTRSTKTRGPKRVASVASNTADLRCIFFQCPHVRRRRSSMLLFSTEEMCRNGCGKVGLSPKLFKTVHDFKKIFGLKESHDQLKTCLK